MPMRRSPIRFLVDRLWRCLNSSDRSNYSQIILISGFTGVLGAAVSILYFLSLESLVNLVWKFLFQALKNAGVFNETFREYNFIWMGSLIYIVVIVLFLLLFRHNSTGGFGPVIEQIHKEGKVSQRYFFPMLIISLLCLSSGSGVGPEAPIMVLSGSASTFFGKRLRLKKRPLRIFVLSGMSAALSGFFGSPLTGLFALEMPHRLGIEYFEALLPAIISSFVGATIMQALLQRSYGSYFSFPTHSDDVAALDLLIGLLLGIAGGAIGVVFMLFTRLFNFLTTKISPRILPFLPFVAWPIFSAAGMCLPPILFWGKPEMQNIINLNQNSTLHHWQGGSSGLIDLGEPYSVTSVFLIGGVKVLLLPFLIFMNIKGGIVFPLFFIGGTFGQGIHMLTGIDQGLAVCAVMAATQACVTRTPLSSALVSVLNARNAPTQILIPVAAASFFATLITGKLGIFPAQGSRTDLQFPEDSQENEEEEEEEGSCLLPPNEASPLMIDPREDERESGRERERESGRERSSFQSINSTIVMRDRSTERFEP